MAEEPVEKPVEDKSKFIRTFAKDVESLGQTVPKEFVPAPAEKKSAPKVEKKVTEKKKSAEETFESLRKAPDPSFVPVQGQPAEQEKEYKPAPLPFSVPLPAPMKKEPVQQAPAFKPAEGPSPLHTYKTDFADNIDTKKASTFSVLAEQLDATTAQPAEKTLVKSKAAFPFVPFLIGLFLILAGGGGVWFAYTLTTNKEITIPAFSVKTLVFADDRKELTGPDFSGAVVQALSDPIDEGKIRVLYSATASSTGSGILHIPNDGNVLIGVLNVHMPDLLLRNITAPSTTGIIKANGVNSPFFVLGVSSYERTFSAMLSWESSIASDLAWLFPAITPTIPVTTVTSTTTATSTTKTKTVTTVATTTPIRIATPTFKDKVVGNYNLRVLTDLAGNSILCYGYTNKETLIIARSPDIFVTIAGRIVEPK